MLLYGSMPSRACFEFEEGLLQLGQLLKKSEPGRPRRPQPAAMVLPVILLLGAGAALEISRRVGAGERAAPGDAPGAAAQAAREARLAAALAALQAELAAEREAHAVDTERAAGVADKCGSLETQLAAALAALQAELAAERAAHAADAERAAGVAGKCCSLEVQVGALHARTEELASSADALLAERGGLREQVRTRSRCQACAICQPSLPGTSSSQQLPNRCSQIAGGAHVRCCHGKHPRSRSTPAFYGGGRSEGAAEQQRITVLCLQMR